MQPGQASPQEKLTPTDRAGGPVSPQTPSSSGSANPIPSINLPKGGGAIRGIGEKFTANPATGSGSLTVPIHSSPGRSGFGPQLSLAYDSGNGNGPFGFGWSLALPAVTRKTEKGLPRYADSQESDTFILSGAEDLAPALSEAAGQWSRDTTSSRTVYSRQYAIHRYRPRVEGLFARIERWINVLDPQDTFWRSISKDNITTWYGKTQESRIADPADASRIFSWLICESYDDKGNATVFQYKPENSDGVDLSQAHERNRSVSTRASKRYIKHVLYGNRTPYFPDLNAVGPVALPTDWCFELVFDYGEHDLLNPVPQEKAQLWNCRLDPFSTYKAAFEVRTYRLCRRVLLFHHFQAEANVGLNCLVRSTDLVHSPPLPPADPSQPFYSYLLSVTQTGYSRDGAGGYLSNSLPPLELQYTTAEVNETVREADAASLQNFPAGADGSHYRWADLDGEGSPGILTEQGASWYYKANLSPVNQQTIGGVEVTLPRFAPVQRIALRPSLADLTGGHQQLLDLSGDGVADLVSYEGPTPGFYERTQDESWEAFVAFPSVPVVDWRSPNLKFVDLTGDGFPDLLIGEDHAFSWHASLAAGGFGPAQRTLQAFDEEKGPKLVFADGSESIFLADISGDGLTDLVRVRNGEVCYWPNLGYGRFGAKVAMDGSPRFDRTDLFDGRRIRLADIDGSGTADIIYFASGRVDLYFNQSGNGWGAKRSLSHFPQVESLSSAMAVDLLGNGTVCLVWSSPLSSNARRPLRYIDLMGGQKPHLLARISNNLGGETVVRYAPSTKSYVADKLAGTPWVTRLPFPVQVVEQVQTYDYISRNLFVSRYSYHHGFFDGVEREFRGFGRVDQYDTEEFATLANSADFPQPTNLDAASHVPPVCTKTWFHTGAFFGESKISKFLEHEYYSEGDSLAAIAGLSVAQAEAMLLDDTVLPSEIRLPDGSRLPYDLSGEELRESCRALRGSILRQEIYALDGSAESDRPYSVSERNYTIEVLQPQGPNQFGVFFVHPRETVDFRYERKLFKVVGNTLVAPNAPPPARSVADPRVAHSLTLAVDSFGNVLQSASVGYGRRYLDPDLAPADQVKQSATLVTLTENTYASMMPTADLFRTPLAAESTTYELIQVQPDNTLADVTNLFRFEELRGKVKAAGDGAHEIHYENLNPMGLNAGETYRRLLERKRTLYRPDDMGASAGDPRALLPLGQLESLALAGETYKLAFTKGLIPKVFQRGVTALLPLPAAVLGSVAADGGGYADLDGDGHWWAPSGRVFYLPTAPSSPQEKNQALQHFFQPRRFEDVFGNVATAGYDPHDLLVLNTLDPAGNVVSAVNDYRVLGPVLVTDPNGNRTAISFDVLGLVAGTATMGKSTENLGDLLTGFSADLTQSQIDGLHNAADPHSVADALLANATTRIVYDVHRFFNSRMAAPADPTKWEPASSATLSRETHFFDVVAGHPSKIQIAFSYSDGYGREIQKKVQAEPGPVVDGGPVVDPRWVGSGWTIFNNKGKPIRKYEPFFSQLPARGHQFEFGFQTGVSSILCYDPLDRVVVTVHPNHTYEKVVFDPWHQESWDVNDTVKQDPAADVDVGNWFARLPVADYVPTWFAARSAGGLGAQEQAASTKAGKHAQTPTLQYFDSLGRAVVTVVDNAGDGKYSTQSELDIQGNQRALTDALGRKVVAYEHNLLRERVHQSSMDAGERWTLKDAAGKQVRTWDSRGHNFRVAYDAMRRPAGLFVLGTDAVLSDPRTLAAEVLYEKIGYGEGQLNDQALNLRTRVFQQRDSAGIVTNQAYDFKGNPLTVSRQFMQDYKALPNWSAAPALAVGSYANSSHFDALNRPLTVTTPDGSVFQPVYNEANLLEAVRVNVRGAVASTPFVTNIDYNAKGQRILIEYGNQTATSYGYDPLTFRLVHLTTTRAGFPANEQTAQDLFYTFDPAGNITHIQDDADLQNVVYFKNQRVEPSGDYTYDAIYRLVQARGREQLGLNGGGPLAPTPASYNDFPRAGLLQRGDGKAVGTYVETYQYDQVGNFLQFIHQGANPANPGWTRAFTYGETSLLEPGKLNNRLSKTTVSGGTPLNEPYLHDLHGNMAGMPQLQTLAWDFKDQLEMTRRQAVNSGDADGVLHQGERTYYVYDATGQRARKVTESALGSVVKERFYLGAFELYREYGGGAVTLERESLHVLDGNKRVVLVETKMKDTGGAGPLPDMTTRYQFGNHLGTACLELDEGGAVISYEEYYPYGATSYQAGRTLIDVGLKRYRYIGSERDEETGLYYCGARYYAGWLGRWTSADPKGIDGGLNLYGYGRGNPVVFSDPGGKDPPAPDIPDLSVTKALQPDKATDKKPTKKTDGDAKKAGSNAGLQNLTDGNPPGGATEPGREQGEVVVAGGANAAPSSEVKGKTDVTGAGSLSVAGRRGIFLTPAGLGLEYGVLLTGSPLVPAPLSLQGTVHLGDSHFGIYGSGGFLTDPSGRPTGTIWSVNFVQGASAFDNQFNLYLNQIITNASTGQVANQSVTDATSAKFLLGIAYNPQVLEKADAAPQPAATTEQRDELTPAPAAPSAAAAEPKKVPGPNAYGGEVSGTISTGKSPILGNLKSGTATALLFYTRAFNNNQNIFGLAAGGSYESGGGGFTGFLRLGIALDRGSGKSPAASPVAGPLSIPLPFLY